MKVKNKLTIACMAVLVITAVMITGAPYRVSAADEVVTVRISSLAFSPAKISIKPGTTVRWVNEDPFPHDVTSGEVVEGRKARQVKKSRLPDGRFHSGAYGGGPGFEYTFKETGDYPYYCTLHPIMTGMVRVVK